MNSVDRVKAYRTLKPYLVSFFADLVREEEEIYEAFQNRGAICQQTFTELRTRPVRIELLRELPELVDKAFGESNQKESQ